MRRLIVTADDFGAAVEVNEAVERAHQNGILSAASLMVAGAAAGDAVTRAKAMPELRVGLHLVLVEGRPILPRDAVPDLVDATGHFRTDMARAGAAMFFFPKVRAQLAAEIEAQFAAFEATGLRLDHVPLEPQDVLGKIEPHKASGVVALTAPFARALRGRFRRADITAPDAVFGLAWSGAMTQSRLAGLIEHLPEGLSEIYTHPATGPYPGSAPGYQYASELAALTDPAVAASLAAKGIRTGGFLDFKIRNCPGSFPVA